MPLLSLASRCSTALLLAVMLSSSHDTDGLLLPRKSLAAAAFQKRARSNTALSSQPQQDDDKGRVWRKFFVPYQEAVDSQNAPTSYMVNREDEDEEMTPEDDAVIEADLSSAMAEGDETAGTSRRMSPIYR